MKRQAIRQAAMREYERRGDLCEAIDGAIDATLDEVEVILARDFNVPGVARLIRRRVADRSERGQR